MTVPYTIQDHNIQYYHAHISTLKSIVGQRKAVIITDTTVFHLYQDIIAQWPCITIPPGESHKNLDTIEYIIQQLIEHNADRETLIIGMGGGVITDITGFVASIYMRGVSFGFIPSTLLNMVDASIGGKNGVDFMLYKNMIGSIRQPDFILKDTQLLLTLSDDDWKNGFAEIIKHALILDKNMYAELSSHDINYYKTHLDALEALIQKNIDIKLKIVQDDVYEKGHRKLLNFGHTLGHAIENLYKLSHGQAISIGMNIAAQLSNLWHGFSSTHKVTSILQQYQLPTHLDIELNTVLEVLQKDKKKAGNNIHFIALKEIGQAEIVTLSIKKLEKDLITLLHV